MDTADNARDHRLAELRRWLSGLGGFDLASLRPASGDASFRRYFRVNSKSGSHVVMDAPTDKEDCEPFIRIAGFLQQMRLHAPVVELANTDAGFLLLSDLGSVQYLGALQKNPALSASLYADALTALARLQERGIEFQHQLPPYDEKLLRFELSLFSDWLCDRHLGIRLDAADTGKWRACCDLLVSSALSQPPVFVHRDYHSRNLMFVDKNNPGILDFQDAVEGPLTYDLVSLLRDCYISWPAAEVRDWALKFQGMSAPARNMAPAEFLRCVDLMGVQRQLKAAGIFARLNHRDGKSSYMLDIPRTLNYIVEIAPHHPELGFLAALVQGRVLRGLRDRPA